ncbi:MAG: TIGR01777 family protein [Bacteroidetes bacterium]|nr:MAG: TIGR01777 family protein [Bacteroidota bacterium]
MQRILITGGTGMIGKRLTSLLLDKGYEVIILTRDASKYRQKENEISHERLSYYEWDPSEKTVEPAAIRNANVIINLAGAGIADKRWTKKRKRIIVSSRVNAGETIVKALQEIPNTINTVINASAIGWYGDDSVRKSNAPAFVETDPNASQYLGITCKAWEDSIEPVKSLGIRLLKFRTGIVLSEEGGALKEFKRPIRFGIAPILGRGDQIISWIHIDDLCRMFLFAIEQIGLSGVYNAVAPTPVSNKNFMISLATKMKSKFFIPFHVPAFLLKLFLGEVSIEVLKSTTVSSEKIKNAGFQFIYPSVESAFEELI